MDLSNPINYDGRLTSNEIFARMSSEFKEKYLTGMPLGKGAEVLVQNGQGKILYFFQPKGEKAIYESVLEGFRSFSQMHDNISAVIVTPNRVRPLNIKSLERLLE